MKKIAGILLVITIVCCLNVKPELFNGRDWVRFLPVMKISYVSGLYDANASLQARLKDRLNSEEIKSTFFLPEEISFKEVTQKLDSFYSEIANIDIPIIYALEIIKMKLSGQSEKAITRFKDTVAEIAASEAP